MAKSTAERQAAYRAKRPFAGDDNNGERRVNFFVSTAAFCALERLAVHHGVSKKQMLETLLIAEQQKTLATLAVDSEEWNQYFSQ
ncbi:hypothetical protein HZU77_016445 [Neisseriaceae bacterium TC5R-5]|nr:hypothetical protein [Neisseriaceae bacterium TC5R-5]